MKQSQKLTDMQKSELNQMIKSSGSTPAEVRRAQAILMLNSEIQTSTISEYTHFMRSQIFELRRKYLSKGIESLKDKRKNYKELLTKGQLVTIVKILETQSPRACGFASDFWTIPLLALFIKESFGVQYKSRSSLYLIFKKARFSFHKPGQVYKKRDDKAINEWYKEIGPRIMEELKTHSTALLAEDEMILRTHTTFQKIWLPRNEYPKIEIANIRKRKAIYGFLNVKSGHEHAYKRDICSAADTCAVLKNIIQEYRSFKKIIVLWDSAPWHDNKQVKHLLEKYEGKIEVIAFPKYAPDLNPQEHVWKAARSAITHNKHIEFIEKAADAVINYLNENIFEYKLPGF